MSTYLQLCQRARQEFGASGSDSTVVGATGEWLRICTWVMQSYIELQEEQPDWDWMRADFSFNTIVNQAAYPPASSPIALADFSMWRHTSFRIYLGTDDNEKILSEMPYSSFRDTYLLGSPKTTYGYPSIISISPSRSLYLALPPNDIYVVSGEYYKTPTVLAADSDVPDLPSRYHMAIIYKAMQMYGAYEASAEAFQRGKDEYRKMLGNIRFNQMPMITVSRSFGV